MSQPTNYVVEAYPLSFGIWEENPEKPDFSPGQPEEDDEVVRDCDSEGEI